MKKTCIYIILFLQIFSFGNIGIIFDTHFPNTFATTTTTLYGTTATDLNDSSFNWINLGNTSGDTTGTFGRVQMNTNPALGNTLALTNFNFAGAGIPAGSQILGIQADVEWRGRNNNVVDSKIQLTKNATTGVGTNLAINSPQTTKAIRTYGSSTQLWGTTWTLADITSPNFGIHLQYSKTAGGNRYARVYRAGITIEYNTLPTDITLTGDTIDEGLPIGTTIGTLSTTDSDVGDTHTYSMNCSVAGVDDSSVSISGANLNSNSVYNYATKSVYNICVRTTDSGGLTFDKNFTFTINDPSIPSGSILDFETPGGYTLTSGTWTRQTTTVQEGIYAIEADNGGVANSSSCFERSETITTDSIVKFQYKVSSEATYDFLKFYIDGVETDSWSGDIDWTEYAIYGVTAGSYTYRWCYEKDGSVNELSDTAWIDIFTVEEDTSTAVGVLDFEVAGGYTVTSGTWTRQTTTVQQGTYAIEADNGGVANSSSCFERNETLTGATDSIGFWYNVSSEAGYDFLRFSVNGTEINSWSGVTGWNQYVYSPGIGTHTLEWCYTKDGSVDFGSDTAWVDDVSIISIPPSGDVTPPTISSLSFASGALLPGGNHDIVLNYTDTGSSINVSSANIILNKWDGVSAWGSDISATGLDLGSSTVGTGSATYPMDNLTYGLYRYIFSIDDTSGNTGSGERSFYIDQPEFLISSGSLDIGDIDAISAQFSDAVTITVKTVGAAFDVTLNNTLNPTYSTENIPTWNGTQGFGYEESPYSGIINTIATDQIIASEPILVNTNGNQNTYTYDIQFGALVDSLQAGGNYEGNVDFSINLGY